MAKRYEEVRKETNKKLEEILSNENEFINFIKFYSRFHKYDFQDALCIYVQNKNATAVADYDTWKRIKSEPPTTKVAGFLLHRILHILNMSY